MVIAALWARRYFGDEAAIRRMFADLSRSVHGEKLVATAGHISRRYSDPRGGAYESLLGGAADLYSGYDDIELAIAVAGVSVSGKTASVDLTFRLAATPAAGGGREALIGSLLDAARARVIVRKTSGDWQVETVEELDLRGR